MAKGIPSVCDLRRKFLVTDDEIAAATAAYLKDGNAELFVFTSGHRVDVAKAIEMHPQVKKLLADEATTPGLHWTMVMTIVTSTSHGPHHSYKLPAGREPSHERAHRSRCVSAS